MPLATRLVTIPALHWLQFRQTTGHKSGTLMIPSPALYRSQARHSTGHKPGTLLVMSPALYYDEAGTLLDFGPTLYYSRFRESTDHGPILYWLRVRDSIVYKSGTLLAMSLVLYRSHGWLSSGHKSCTPLVSIPLFYWLRVWH